MRSNLSALLLMPLLALASFQQGQGGDELDVDKLPPLTRHRVLEQRRLEKGLVGVWKMTLAESSRERIDATKIGGMLSFQDGVMQLTVRLTLLDSGLFKTDEEAWVHTSAHHYRVDALNRLQTASIFGFENWNEDNELRYIQNERFGQWSVTLDERTLLLEKSDGKRFTFVRLKDQKFPARAEEWLRRTRGGTEPLVEPPRRER